MNSWRARWLTTRRCARCGSRSRRRRGACVRRACARTRPLTSPAKRRSVPTTISRSVWRCHSTSTAAGRDGVALPGGKGSGSVPRWGVRNGGPGAEVRVKAGELLAARRNLRVTEDLLRVNREGLGLIGERVRRGATPPLEESLLQVEVNRLDASQKLLAGRADVLAVQLKALVGTEPDVPLALRGELAAPPLAVDRAVAANEALARRGEPEAARAPAPI